MSFNSIEFLVFYTVVVTLFFALDHRFRWMLLVAASLYFYMSWRAEYVLLILFSGVVDYWAGLRMGRFSTTGERRPFLILSLITNLGLLFSFKYFNFLNGSLSQVTTLFGAENPIPYLDILLPVGISFYTFQTMSYSIEVYWGRMKPERHFGLYMLYVSYFPQLVAGPIERPQQLLHQFKQRVRFDHGRISSGVKLMAWGLFKKVMIADRVGVMVGNIYSDPGQHEGPALILATLLFAVQIYCDFSGYSDIAIGAARVMGVDLMKNFNAPYLARSIGEFWRRWHISLSSWFRDYVYIPLGGNRKVKWRWYYNLFITFLLSGIWHGANWTFVIWGGLHGAYLVADRMTNGGRQRLWERIGLVRMPGLHNVLRIVSTTVLVCIGWVFFRANNLADALQVFQRMPFGLEGFFGPEAAFLYAPILGVGFLQMLLAVASIAVLVAVDFVEERPGGVNVMLAARPAWQRWTAYYILIGSMIFFGAYYVEVPFIYFQF